MEENKNTNVDTQTSDGAQATTNRAESTEKIVTMSQTDFDKAIQSAEDRVRGKMSKTIKELQEKVKELTPVEKTQDQIDLENRIAALEKSEKEVAAQKKRLDIPEQLSGKGIDKSMVDFLRADADLEAFSDLIDTITKTRMKSSGYVPGEPDGNMITAYEGIDEISLDLSNLGVSVVPYDGDKILVDTTRLGSGIRDKVIISQDGKELEVETGSHHRFHWNAEDPGML